LNVCAGSFFLFRYKSKQPAICFPGGGHWIEQQHRQRIEGGHFDEDDDFISHITKDHGLEIAVARHRCEKLESYLGIEGNEVPSKQEKKDEHDESVKKEEPVEQEQEQEPDEEDQDQEQEQEGGEQEEEEKDEEGGNDENEDQSKKKKHKGKEVEKDEDGQKNRRSKSKKSYKSEIERRWWWEDPLENIRLHELVGAAPVDREKERREKEEKEEKEEKDKQEKFKPKKEKEEVEKDEDGQKKSKI